MSQVRLLAIAIQGAVLAAAAAATPAAARPIASYRWFHAWTGANPSGVALVSTDPVRIRSLARKKPYYMGSNVRVAWSPDGRRVAFEAGGEHNHDIYIANRRTGDVRRITASDDVEIHPSWARGGRRLVIQRGTYDDNRDGDIYVIAAGGSSQRALTHNRFDETDPVWSPDGTRIAFQSDKGLVTIKPDGSGRRRLTRRLFDYEPEWSPNSQWLLFVRYQQGSSHIVRIRRNGSDLQQLTYGKHHDEEADWSPGGSRVVFVRSDAFGRRLATISRRGKNLRILYRRTADKSDSSMWPTWSPTGGRIAFSSAGNVRVIRRDGSRLRKLTSDGAYFGLDW